jgi:histone deacetylase 1/2
MFNWIGGGGYLKLNKLFDDTGISHRVSCPHTHQENGGMVERKHRHIIKTRLTILAHGSIPFRFWSDAFRTTWFSLNLVPSCVVDMKPPLSACLEKK